MKVVASGKLPCRSRSRLAPSQHASRYSIAWYFKRFKLQRFALQRQLVNSRVCPSHHERSKPFDRKLQKAQKATRRRGRLAFCSLARRWRGGGIKEYFRLLARLVAFRCKIVSRSQKSDLFPAFESTPEAIGEEKVEVDDKQQKIPCLKRNLELEESEQNLVAASKVVRLDQEESPEVTCATKKVVDQLHVLTYGLMGSGKSTVVQVIAKLLGGRWVNQDEFNHLGRRAKNGFLDELWRAACSKTGAIFVDKINVLRQHRSEIFTALGAPVEGWHPGRVLLRFYHPDDQRGALGPKALHLCMHRIKSRGSCHRTLRSDNPKLSEILWRTMATCQPPDEHELAQFDAVLDVDMTCTIEENVAKVLKGLFEVFSIYKSVPSSLDISNAVSEVRRREESLSSRQTFQVESKQVQEKLSQTNNCMSRPLYWCVAFDSAEATEFWRKQRENVLESSFKVIHEPHVTLVYLGRRTDADAARNACLPELEFVSIRKACESIEGKTVEVIVSKTVSDANLACVSVSLPEYVPCANAHPHVTLGHSVNSSPRESNGLLQRLAQNPASVDIKVQAFGSPQPVVRGVISAKY